MGVGWTICYKGKDRGWVWGKDGLFVIKVKLGEGCGGRMDYLL